MLLTPVNVNVNVPPVLPSFKQAPFDKTIFICPDNVDVQVKVVPLTPVLYTPAIYALVKALNTVRVSFSPLAVNTFATVKE